MSHFHSYRSPSLFLLYPRQSQQKSKTKIHERLDLGPFSPILSRRFQPLAPRNHDEIIDHRIVADDAITGVGLSLPPSIQPDALNTSPSLLR